MALTKPTQTRAEIIAEIIAATPPVDDRPAWDENDNDNPDGMSSAEMFDAFALTLPMQVRRKLYAPFITENTARAAEPDTSPTTKPASKAVTSLTLPTETTPAAAPPSWLELGDAKQAVLLALSQLAERMLGQGVAKKAGYKYGSLRHHFGKLVKSNYIDKTKDGYAITSAGRALIPSKSV